MSAVNDFHHRAMDFAGHALIERLHGNLEQANKLFEQALGEELAAIEALPEPEEPTYSVLHRSAATLAMDCNRLRQAEQIAASALAHNPHPEIAEELRDLLEQIYFQRHLSLRGVELGVDEMQMSLSGQEVGFGFVRSSELLKRIETSSKLIYRIFERKRGQQFKERGGTSKGLKESHPIFLSVPRAASYAVTLKLGGLVGQPSLPGLSGAADVIDEFMDLMGLVSNKKVSEVESRINDPAYYRNFLALAKEIAPDGAQIRQVGFTALRNGRESAVEVRIPQSEFPSPHTEKSSSGKVESVEIRGTLRFADAIRDESNRIRIIDEGGRSHTVLVPKGMMNDIVSPHWDSKVLVRGIRSQDDSTKAATLVDISSLEEDETE